MNNYSMGAPDTNFTISGNCDIKMLATVLKNVSEHIENDANSSKIVCNFDISVSNAHCDQNRVVVHENSTEYKPPGVTNATDASQGLDQRDENITASTASDATNGHNSPSRSGPVLPIESIRDELHSEFTSTLDHLVPGSTPTRTPGTASIDITRESVDNDNSAHGTINADPISPEIRTTKKPSTGGSSKGSATGSRKLVNKSPEFRKIKARAASTPKRSYSVNKKRSIGLPQMRTPDFNQRQRRFEEPPEACDFLTLT